MQDKMKRLLSQTKSSLPAIAALLLLAAPMAQAQAIYRIVDPDGRVRFSDQPPAPDDKATTLPPSGRASTASSEAGGLPLALRQIVNRYPVTLYTGDNCDPCGSGRSVLTSRGIPFTERTVTTPQDAEALQKLTGQSSLPMLTIGGQQLKGFVHSEWSQYLDAAGYPATSQLPSGYRNPAPTPLTSAASAPARQPQESRQNTPPPPPPPGPSPSNPAGITF
jgi:glutaredoxin